MAATPSKMIALGTRAPGFTLTDVISGNPISTLQPGDSKGLLILFICNHCPYVIHIIKKLTAIANTASDAGIQVFAICSNDAKQYPEDGPEEMIVFSEKHNFRFPYLYDESQETARTYGATCTPDIFLFDDKHLLYYRGQFDASRPGSNIEVSGSDLRKALEALLRGESAPAEQRPSIGCNIKWK